MKDVKKILFFFVALFFISCSSGEIEEYNDSELYISRDDSTIESGVINSDVLNACKRARQFLDIEWEAKSSMPSISAYEGIWAGPHKGIPYSSVKEYNKFVGYDVSIKTFMTALHNKYSLLYTENVLGKRSTSAYGIEYQGTNCGAYMGTVCTFFVDYVLGLEIPYVSYEYQHLEELGVFERIDSQSVDSIKILDVIWEPGHASIITDVTRDSSGKIMTVNMAESASTYVKLREMGPAQVQARLIDKKGVIYRYKKLSDSRDYIPSEFVAVFDEKPEEYKYNDDICTFAGDYACFREGDLIVINYEKKDFSYMEIVKDDTVVATIDLPEDSSNHAINIQDYALLHGNYKVRLIGEKEVSDYTFFEVLQTDVELDYDGDYQKVYFNSSNSKPIYLQFGNRQGDSFGKYVFTEDDINRGYALVNAKDLLMKFRGLSSFGTDVYLKVFFQGEYGRVTNHFLKTNIK